MADKRKPGGLDLTDFAPTSSKTDDIPKEHVQQAAKASAAQAGFSSREAPPVKIDGRTLRKTARNTQMNLKVTEETHARFWRFATSLDGVSGGQALETLLEMAEREK